MGVGPHDPGSDGFVLSHLSDKDKDVAKVGTQRTAQGGQTGRRSQGLWTENPTATSNGS
jgi:hypothetical protein